MHLVNYQQSQQKILERKEFEDKHINIYNNTLPIKHNQEQQHGHNHAHNKQKEKTKVVYKLLLSTWTNI